MVEPILTPAHPDSLEPLLNKPFTGTFDHPAAQRQSQVLVHGIVDVLAMPLQIGIHGPQGLPCCLRQPLDISGIRQVGQHTVRHAMPQAVPCPATPPAGLGRPPIQPGGRALPQLLHGVIKVQHAPCMAREALLKEAPQPAATVAEPNHVGGRHDALAHGFAPQPGTERLDVPQDGHETAVLQPCDDVAQPCAMLA